MLLVDDVIAAINRHDPHQTVIDRALERAAVHHQLDPVAEGVWSGLGQMLAVVIAALPHDVPEQDRALGEINQIVQGGRDRVQGNA